MRENRGLMLSLAAVHRQLAAMPCPLYEVRLIHSVSRKPYPGVRQWTSFQLADPATVRFLRIRNREGYDVYFRPYAGDHNAGYILLDLDQPVPGILARCGHRAMSRAWWSRPVPDDGRPGFTLAMSRCHPHSPRALPSSWRSSMRRIAPAPIGAMSEDWPDSRTANFDGAGWTVWLLG